MRLSFVPLVVWSCFWHVGVCSSLPRLLPSSSILKVTSIVNLLLCIPGKLKFCWNQKEKQVNSPPQEYLIVLKVWEAISYWCFLAPKKVLKFCEMSGKVTIAGSNYSNITDATSLNSLSVVILLFYYIKILEPF